MLVFPDNVKFITSTTGTGTLSVGSAVSNHRGMDVVANDDQVIYRIDSGSDWEIGIGTWNSSAETLTRTVRRSTNSNSALNLPSGDKEVFIGVSEDELGSLASITIDGTGDLTISKDLTIEGELNTAIIANSFFLSTKDLQVTRDTSFGGPLRPSTTGTYDIGTSLLRWRNAWFAEDVAVGNQLSVGGDANFSFGLAVGTGLIVGEGATFGGTLFPESTNTYDLGSTGIRWRDGFFSRNVAIGGFTQLTDADISGKLDVGGLVTANNGFFSSSGVITTSSGTITGATIAATSAMTIRGKQAGPLMPGYTGLRISRTSTTVISIAKGSIHNNLLSRRIDLASAMTLDLANSGHFVNSSSRATNTWYHVLIGLDGDTVVAGLSTTLAKPAAWDSWQMIGAAWTDETGSGEWSPMQQIGNEFWTDTPITDYSNSSPGTTAITIRAHCPPIKCRISIRAIFANPSSVPLLRFLNDASSEVLYTMISSSNVDASQCLNWVTNSDGEYIIRLDSTTTFSTFVLGTMGFEYPVGEAAFYE